LKRNKPGVPWRLRIRADRPSFNSMVYRRHARQTYKLAEPDGGRNIRGNSTTQPAPEKSQRPQLHRVPPAWRGVASQAFTVMLQHEVTKARRTCGLDQQLSIGAYRLKPVMLDHQRLSKQ